MLIVKLRRDRRGATAVEYALVAALVSLAAMASVQSIGNQISRTLLNAGSNMKAS